jgi:Cu/Ag efflux pump CusA
VVRTAVAMRPTAVYASLVIALAVTPVFFVPGSPGALVAPLAVTYLVGLAAAMLVALLVLPALMSLRAARPGPARKGPPSGPCTAATTGSVSGPCRGLARPS